jgi:hypothetical protein
MHQLYLRLLECGGRKLPFCSAPPDLALLKLGVSNPVLLKLGVSNPELLAEGEARKLSQEGRVWGP